MDLEPYALLVGVGFRAATGTSSGRLMRLGMSRQSTGKVTPSTNRPIPRSADSKFLDPVLKTGGWYRDPPQPIRLFNIPPQRRVHLCRGSPNVVLDTGAIDEALAADVGIDSCERQCLSLWPIRFETRPNDCIEGGVITEPKKNIFSRSWISPTPPIPPLLVQCEDLLDMPSALSEPEILAGVRYRMLIAHRPIGTDPFITVRCNGQSQTCCFSGAPRELDRKRRSVLVPSACGQRQLAGAPEQRTPPDNGDSYAASSSAETFHHAAKFCQSPCVDHPGSRSIAQHTPPGTGLCEPGRQMRESDLL